MTEIEKVQREISDNEEKLKEVNLRLSQIKQRIIETDLEILITEQRGSAHKRNSIQPLESVSIRPDINSPSTSPSKKSPSSNFDSIYQRIQRHMAKITEMVNKGLEISKVRTGKITIDSKPLDSEYKGVGNATRQRIDSSTLFNCNEKEEVDSETEVYKYRSDEFETDYVKFPKQILGEINKINSVDGLREFLIREYRVLKNNWEIKNLLPDDLEDVISKITEKKEHSWKHDNKNLFNKYRNPETEIYEPSNYLDSFDEIFGIKTN